MTALAGGCTLVSADRDFAAIDGLAYVDPASPELETLLRD